MVMGKQKIFKKWMWKCPYEECDAHSRIPLNWHKAARHGRNHLKKIHKDRETQPIVLKTGGENESELSGMQKKDTNKKRKPDK
jgi:hypothetical protein